MVSVESYFVSNELTSNWGATKYIQRNKPVNRFSDKYFYNSFSMLGQKG